MRISFHPYFPGKTKLILGGFLIGNIIQRPLVGQWGERPTSQSTLLTKMKNFFVDAAAPVLTFGTDLNLLQLSRMSHTGNPPTSGEPSDLEKTPKSVYLIVKSLETEKQTSIHCIFTTHFF
jgi:hypothetical protein